MCWGPAIGAEQTGRFILDSLGIDYQEKFTLAYMGYGPTTSAIQDGNIVGMNIPAGAPVSSITQAYALMGERMTILNWSQESLMQSMRATRSGTGMNSRRAPIPIKPN